jgi:hypothetical protein
MKTEFIQQYGHTWRVFAGLVSGFDSDAWLHTGRGAITPARLALHISQSAIGYMQDATPVGFDSGRPFECVWNTAPETDLPAQADLLAFVVELQMRTQKWLTESDFMEKNEAFPWAGETKMGVVLFSLRHTLYHLGELSSLLNESKSGKTEDIYVKSI